MLINIPILFFYCSITLFSFWFKRTMFTPITTTISSINMILFCKYQSVSIHIIMRREKFYLLPIFFFFFHNYLTSHPAAPQAISPDKFVSSSNSTILDKSTSFNVSISFSYSSFEQSVKGA